MMLNSRNIQNYQESDRRDSAGGLTTWEEDGSIKPSSHRLISLIAESPNLDMMSLLAGSFGQERFFWAEPRDEDGNELIIIGIGIAIELTVPSMLERESSVATTGFRFTEIERQAERLFENAVIISPESRIVNHWELAQFNHIARPRLFGGFAFQDDFIPDNTWSLFTPAQFVLPHFQAVQLNGRRYLSINALIDEDEPLEINIEALRDALTSLLTGTTPQKTRPIKRTELRYPMLRESWSTLIDRTTEAIHNGHMKKVVLSRVCEVGSDEPFDGVATLDYLNTTYNDSYRFLFEPYPQHAFLGATPEVLIQKEGEQVTTMALAGSIARGSNPGEDIALADELLHSLKNRHEHQLVVQAIVNSLDGIVEDLSVADEPVVLALRNIQHLLTPIGGRVDDHQVSLLDLVRRLHPTPAMGGVPTADAMAFLRRNEPVPRGWYAAPIGWLDAQGNGLFVVAIRSAVIQHNRAWLYAGAGIVGDSQPEHEWAETALKFRPMLGAFGIEEIV